MKKSTNYMNEHYNKRLIQFIFLVHEFIENNDLQIQRDNQNQLATFLSNEKCRFTSVDVNTIHYEWT